MRHVVLSVLVFILALRPQLSWGGGDSGNALSTRSQAGFRWPCSTCSHRASRGLRQVDEHVLASIKSIGQYRKALAPFLLYLSWHSLNSSDAEEFDDLRCEWKADTTWAGSPAGRGPTRGEFEKAIAAVEKAVPKLKGSLLEARAVAKSWKVVVKPHPTVPLARPWALLLGCWLSQHGPPGSAGF